jgi:hypothetical protein
MISPFAVGETLTVTYERFGAKKTALVKLATDPQYHIGLIEKNGEIPSKEILQNRQAWLHIKQ